MEERARILSKRCNPPSKQQPHLPSGGNRVQFSFYLYLEFMGKAQNNSCHFWEDKNYPALNCRKLLAFSSRNFSINFFYPQIKVQGEKKAWRSPA